jgi:parvulin-like peptidyl-prolyl isomerase
MKRFFESQSMFRLVTHCLVTHTLWLVATTVAYSPNVSAQGVAAQGSKVAAGTGPVAAAPDAATNSIVAVVNADPITADQLSHEAVLRYGVDMLDNMINRHLILQACTQAGIEVTNADVSAEIQRIAAKFNLPLDQYLKLLQDERDISPDQYAREVVWPMMALRRLVHDRVQVTDEEFNRAFLARYGEAVKCRMILVDKRDTAESLRARAVAAPAEFGALAKQFSQDEASASVRGLIPPIRRYTGDSRIEEVAFSLKDDEISEVLQLGDQWIVLQAVRRMPASNPAPQAMPAIREQIIDAIRDEKVRETASELFATLQREAKVVKVLGDEAAMKQNPGVAAIVNNQKVMIAQVAAECVKRHGSTVLEGEINRKLLTQALAKAKKTVTQEDLDAEVNRAAVAYGFVRADGKGDTTAWIESVLAEGVATQEIYYRDSVWPSVALAKLVEGTVSVTEDDLREGYESNYGPRVEVLAIVLSDQRTAQKIWDMARNNPTDEFFGSLAEQYSIEPVSQSNFGKVPPLRKFGGQPALEKEAFSLKPGELSGIVATGDKFIVMRCQGFTEPVVADFGAVREELMLMITEKKNRLAMAQLFDKLKQNAQVDNFFEVAKRSNKVASAKPAAAPAAKR